MSDFQNEVEARVSAIRNNKQLNDMASKFMQSTLTAKYSYNFFG